MSRPSALCTQMVTIQCLPISIGSSSSNRWTSAGPYWLRNDTKPMVRSWAWPPGLRQEASGGRVEERGRRTWIHERHRHTEMSVDAAQLTQVRQLVRTRHVTDGWEERVLNDGPQQDVRAEPRRPLGGFAHQR